MMQRRSQLRTAMLLLRQGRYANLLDRLRREAWSEKRFVGLRRDLSENFQPPRAPVQFVVRPMQADDTASLLSQPPSASDAVELTLRRHWVEKGLKGCYVAAVNGGPACFMQWLFTASDNQQIREFFGDSLPQLSSDTIMLEGAYTPPPYRRIPLMPAAMARIAAMGRELGARWAVIYIGDDNTSMIKAAQWAGFVPFEDKYDRRRLFRRAVVYRPSIATT